MGQHFDKIEATPVNRTLKVVYFSKNVLKLGQ